MPSWQDAIDSLCSFQLVVKNTFLHASNQEDDAMRCTSSWPAASFKLPRSPPRRVTLPARLSSSDLEFAIEEHTNTTDGLEQHYEDQPWAVVHHSEIGASVTQDFAGVSTSTIEGAPVSVGVESGFPVLRSTQVSPVAQLSWPLVVKNTFIDVDEGDEWDLLVHSKSLPGLRMGSSLGALCNNADPTDVEMTLIQGFNILQSPHAALDSISEALTSLHCVLENTVCDVIDDSVQSMRQYLQEPSAYTGITNFFIADADACAAPDVQRAKSMPIMETAGGTGLWPDARRAKSMPTMKIAGGTGLWLEQQPAAVAASPSLWSDNTSLSQPRDLSSLYELKKNAFIDGINEDLDLDLVQVEQSKVEQSKSEPGCSKSCHCVAEETQYGDVPCGPIPTMMANSLPPAPLIDVNWQDESAVGTNESHSSPEKACPSPILNWAAASELSCSSSGTILCHMEPHSRASRCRKQFVQSSSVIICGQSAPVKLFVSPCPTKPMSRNLCFRSPKARLKLELRVDFEQRGGKQLDDEIGCIDIIFTVDSISLKEGVCQQVMHKHNFGKTPSCTCPVIFDPPPADTTWVVQAQLTPVDDGVRGPGAGGSVGHAGFSQGVQG